MSGNQEMRRSALLKRVIETVKKDIDHALSPPEREAAAHEKLSEMFGKGWKSEAALAPTVVIDVEDEGEGPKSSEEVEEFWRKIQEFSQKKGIEDNEHLQYDHGKSTERDVMDKREGKGSKEEIKCLLSRAMELMEEK